MANLQLIKPLLDKNNLSVDQFAEKIGLKRGAVYNLIAENSTKIETLEKIAKVLDVPISYFFNETEQNEYQEKVNSNKIESNLTIPELVRQNGVLQKQVSDLITMQLINSESIRNLTSSEMTFYKNGEAQRKKVQGEAS